MGKKENGAGTIRKRPDGRYEARATVGFDDAGKQLRRSLYGRTKADVQVQLIELQGKVNKGGSVPRGRMPTLAQYAEKWIAEFEKAVKAGERRPSTLARYRISLAQDILPLLGSKPLTKLEVADVRRLLRAAVSKGKRPATANRNRELLRNILRDAERDDKIKLERNAAALCKPLDKAGNTRTPRPLEGEHIPAFIELCGQHREGPAWLFLLGMGWRLGEVLGLRWGDIDLGAGTIQLLRELRRDKVDGTWRYILQEPKTMAKAPEHAQRTVSMPHFVVLALERQKALQAQERLVGGAAWLERHESLGEGFRGFVFLLEDGSVINASAFTHRLKETLVEAGLPPTPPKDLGRHTMSALAAGQGVDPKHVAIALGHTRPSTTTDVYTRRTIELTAMVAAALDRAVTPQASSS